MLVLLQGGETPYVLRERDPKPRPDEPGEGKGKEGDEEKRYVFIGETYVPGLMEGNNASMKLLPENIKRFHIQ